jgi:hypothetical protein
MNSLEGAHCRPQYAIAFKEGASKPPPSHFDLVGQGDFLLARQQWNFADLCQVQAYGIASPRFFFIWLAWLGPRIVGLFMRPRVRSGVKFPFVGQRTSRNERGLGRAV